MTSLSLKPTHNFVVLRQRLNIVITEIVYSSKIEKSTAKMLVTTIDTIHTNR